GQDVLQDDARATGAARTGGLDEVTTAHRNGRAFSHAGHGRDEHHHQREDQVAYARPEDGRDDDRQQHGREREEHIKRAHDHHAYHAAVVTCDQPEQGADRTAEGDRRDAGDERRAPTPDEAAEHIPPLFVGPEQVARAAGRRQAVDGDNGQRILQTKDRRGHRDEDQRDEEEQA